MTWISKIQAAIDYIEGNLFDELSADAVAREIGYAPSSFQNLFSAITGYSIGEYIRFRRLSCALERLLKGERVTELAFDCGYENAESFTRAFRRLFGVNPSAVSADDLTIYKYDPIKISISLNGGFSMTRNVIPNLLKVDWSDTARQNEFVNSVISALNAIGEELDYDGVCALSGSAFRTSFSMPDIDRWNHGNYHVIHTPDIIAHTFKMLGFSVSHRVRGDYEADKRAIMASIDRGTPVITLEGVINNSDACIISGYDRDGDVLLGYSPFMNEEADHDEAPDGTGYFRKSGWYEGFCARGSLVKTLIIEGRCEKPSREEAFAETLRLIKRLILAESLAPGQYNGLAAHRAFANALQSYEWEDNFEPYMNAMCNEKQYLDRRCAVRFFEDNGRADLAAIYREIVALTETMLREVPQDFSAFDKFGDKANLRPFCDAVLAIAALEEKAAGLM